MSHLKCDILYHELLTKSSKMGVGCLLDIFLTISPETTIYDSDLMEKRNMKSEFISINYDSKSNNYSMKQQNTMAFIA